MRLLYLTFFGSNTRTKLFNKKIHEPYIFMLLPMLILAIFSIFAGYMLKDLFIGFGSITWMNSIFLLPNNLNNDAEFISLIYNFKQFPFIVTCSAAILAIALYAFNPYYLYNLSFRYNNLFTFFLKKWSFDIIYNEIIVRFFLYLGYQGTFKTVDRGLLEFIGPSGISKIVTYFATTLSNLQTGFIFHYLTFFFLGFLIPLLGFFYSLFFLPFSSLTDYFILSSLILLSLPVLLKRFNKF